MAFRRVYEIGQLASIAGEFQALIGSSPAEEQVQEFIEAHPVVWSFLSPIKILHKPPVLTKKKADFGVLTSHKILYLIEIEKPQTQLATKLTTTSAELQRGIDQIKDWGVVVGDHRHALLSELDLKDDDVHDIRYLLIAGTAHKTTKEALIKLKRSPLALNTQFMCFDELAAILFTLGGQLDDLSGV